MLKTGALASLTTIAVYTVTAWAVVARVLLLVAMRGCIFLVVDALAVTMVTAASVVIIAGCQGQGLIPSCRHGNCRQVALVAG